MTNFIHQPSTNNIKDFTKEKKEVRFRLDDDVFEVREKLPTIALIMLNSRIDDFEKKTGTEQIEAIDHIIRTVLKIDSADRFLARMAGELEPAIDFNDITNIIPWIMTTYGDRPTKPPEDSSGGSPNPESSSSSMESAEKTVSIPLTSHSPDF